MSKPSHEKFEYHYRRRHNSFFCPIVLIAIGVIYVLRSLMLPSELVKVLLRGYPLRFVVFSTSSLAAGLLHLIGTLAR